MNLTLENKHGNQLERVERALEAIRAGKGVLVADSPDRENEVDIIYSAETITREQMALLIRECSGIVCLCMPQEKIESLDLPMMVEHNTSGFQAAFTVTIEAATGVTTGVSASDRVRTIQAAIADNARPEDLRRPGHVFPLRARAGGVLERPGHTEASIDLMRLAGMKPYGVICEMTNPDGTMTKLDGAMDFAEANDLAILTIADLIAYRKKHEIEEVYYNKAI